MKPQRLHINLQGLQSFGVRRDTVPNINNRWHYHPEVELIYFKKGKGTQFVGDNIRQFNCGDVALIGSSLPHYWRFENQYFEQKASTDVCVVHFDQHFWGSAFLDLPENKSVKLLLQKAQKGIQLTGNKQKISSLMEELLIADHSRKIILLLEVLLTISQNSYHVLSSTGFSNSYSEIENNRISNIYDYTLANFNRKISILEIAAVSNISMHSFCRYFKSRTGKTYTRFVNEIRIGHACKLLIENKLNIKTISDESGFCNFASFYKQFKLVTKKSPLKYQHDFLMQSSLNQI